jgi:hypothetical protein
MNWLAWAWLPWRRSITASSLAPLPPGPTPSACRPSARQRFSTRSPNSQRNGSRASPGAVPRLADLRRLPPRRGLQSNRRSSRVECLLGIWGPHSAGLPRSTRRHRHRTRHARARLHGRVRPTRRQSTRTCPASCCCSTGITPACAARSCPPWRGSRCLGYRWKRSCVPRSSSWLARTAMADGSIRGGWVQPNLQPAMEPLPTPEPRQSNARRDERDGLRRRFESCPGNARPPAPTPVQQRPQPATPPSAYTVQRAWVGDIRAARNAGRRPARAPMSSAAASPPAQASVGMTADQCLVCA